MTAQISKSEQDERGLLPYPVIIAATNSRPIKAPFTIHFS